MKPCEGLAQEASMARPAPPAPQARNSAEKAKWVLYDAVTPYTAPSQVQDALGSK